MLKVITGVLGTLLKMPETEVAELLKKPDGSEGIDEDKLLQIILDKDKNRIAAIKAEAAKVDGSPKWADALKKATKEVWTAVENKIKEQFSIESDLQGEELIDHVSETVKEQAKAAGGKKGEAPTEDDIKKHPVFLRAEKDWKKQLTDKEVEKVNALKEVEDKFTQKETFTRVKEAALAKFKKVGEVILPADADKAERMIQRLLIDELSGYTYEVDEKGKFNVLNKDGKRIEDEHGYAMDFDAVVEKIAKSNFDFKVASDRGAPGNGKPKPDEGKPGEKKFTGKAPANKAEYLDLLTNDSLSSEQKLEVKGEYGQQFNT